MTFQAPAPFSVAVPPQLVSFRQPRRSYTVHNAKAVQAEPLFWGQKMIIPPAHEVSPHSDVDIDGDPIPGTYVVEDMFTPIPEIGDEVLTFDATQAVKHILGLQPGSDGTAAIATSPYALSGLSLLPRHASKELWKAVALAGEKRAFVATVERAREYVRGVDEANGKRKAAGVEPIPVGAEYDWARATIDEYNKLVRSSRPTTMSPVAQDALEDEIELDAIARAKADEIATRISAERGIDKLQLLKSLLDDPKVRQLAQKEYQIRKRGNLPVNASKLSKAAADGKTVSESGAEPK